MVKYHFKYLLLLAVSVLFIAITSCKNDEVVDAADYTCKRLPLFINATGLNANRSAFSTSEQHIMGLVLKEFPQPGSNEQPKIYQHPSWKMGGWLSPIQVDNTGDIYTAPAAFINLQFNPLSKRNTLYKVNSSDGIMNEFMALPIPDTTDHRNPYGILSIAFNCKRNILYVSSVAGSTTKEEKGCIYAIDIATKKIIDQVKGKDFFGIQVVVANDKLWLLAGSTRNSGIFSIKINANGTFGGNAENIASIEGLGLRGDDKVKKIIFKAADNIQVKGLEFNYNLIAPTEKQESSYDFYYDMDAKAWALKK